MQRFEEKKASGQEAGDQIDINSFVETFFIKWIKAEKSNDYQELQRLYFTLFDREVISKMLSDESVIQKFQYSAESVDSSLDFSKGTFISESDFAKFLSEPVDYYSPTFTTYEINRIFLQAILTQARACSWAAGFKNALKKALQFFDAQLDSENLAFCRPLKRHCYSAHFIMQIRYLSEIAQLGISGAKRTEPSYRIVPPDDIDSPEQGALFSNFFRNFDNADKHENKISKMALKWLEKEIAFKISSEVICLHIQSFLFCLPDENQSAFLNSASSLIEKLLVSHGGRGFYDMFSSQSKDIKSKAIKKFLGAEKFKKIISSDDDLRWMLSVSAIQYDELTMIDDEWLYEIMKKSNFYKETVHMHGYGMETNDVICFNWRQLCVIFRDATRLKEVLLDCESSHEAEPDELRIEILEALKKEGLRKLLSTPLLVQEIYNDCSEKVRKALLETMEMDVSLLPSSSQAKDMDLSSLEESKSQASEGSLGVAALIARSRNYMPIQQTSPTESVSAMSLSKFESKNN